jgi:hypothetical protein
MSCDIRRKRTEKVDKGPRTPYKRGRLIVNIGMPGMNETHSLDGFRLIRGPAAYGMSGN